MGMKCVNTSIERIVLLGVSVLLAIRTIIIYIYIWP